MQNPPDKFVQVGKINTRYWDIGQSDIPVILVHGIITSVEYWERNVPELAKNHRVIAFDLIGFGKTDKPNITYNLDDFVHFLKLFLDQLNVTQCFLIGHSFGGSLCLKFTLDFPTKVKKLILVSSAGFSRKLPLNFRLLSLPLCNKLIYHATPKTIIHTIRQHIYDKNSLSDSFLERMYQLNHTYKAQRTLLKILQNSINLFGIRKKTIEPITKHFSELKHPILIIWGKQDKLLPLKDVDQNLIPHARWYIFDKCGHLPQMEHADKFNRLVRDFLTN